MKPLRPSQHYGIAGFKGGPQLGPNYTQRRQSLGQRVYFFSGRAAFALWPLEKKKPKLPSRSDIYDVFYLKKLSFTVRETGAPRHHGGPMEGLP